MPKSKTKKKLIRLVHVQAVIFIIIYYIISNSVFYGSVFHSNIYVSFIAPFIFGLMSSFVFLYLFNHRDFFSAQGGSASGGHFISNLEEEEEKAEKKYLGRFSRYGKFAASILVAAVGGPIFLALTIRFLYPKSKRKYFIAFISVLISTIISVSIAKGLFKMIF